MRENPVINSNPFGPVTLDEVLAFEAEHGLQFPDDYRQYLTEHNGGEFTRRTFMPPESPDDGASLHHMLGLHEGPDSLRLQMRFRFSRCYDLHPFEAECRQYFVFADTDTGSLLLIKMSTGAVYVFHHEDVMEETVSELRSAIYFVSETFTSFVGELMTGDEYFRKTMDEDAYRDFQKRLREAKRQWEVADEGLVARLTYRINHVWRQFWARNRD